MRVLVSGVQFFNGMWIKSLMFEKEDYAIANFILRSQAAHDKTAFLRWLRSLGVVVVRCRENSGVLPRGRPGTRDT